MQPAYAVDFLRSVASEYRHTETFALVARIVTSEVHQVVPTDAHALRISTHVLSEETFIEVVVSGGNGRVYGVERRSAYEFDGLVERESAFHIVADTLYVDKGCMSFVAVVYVFADAQTLECQHTADTQQDFLFEAVFPVATIKLMCDGAVELAVHVVVRIEQVKCDSAHIDTPYVGVYVVVQIGYVNHQVLSVLIEHLVDGQLSEVLGLVVGNLLSVHRQRLREVSIAVEETDGAEVDIAVGGFFQVVACQHAQTAGIDFQHMVQPVLHAEVGYRRTFRIRFYIHIGAELCIDVVHAAQDGLVGRQGFEFLVAHAFEQEDGVLSHFLPQGGIEVTEQFGGFIVPRPPNVASDFRQFHQFLRNARLDSHVLPVRCVHITYFNFHKGYIGL